MLVARRLPSLVAWPAAAALLVLAPTMAQAQTSKTFSGAKVNAGTVTLSKQAGKTMLTLSDDFKVPDTPDPHWQVVDSQGRSYVLQRLNVKGALAGVAGDKVNRTIAVPDYVKDIAKVQIYCSWAEAVLGETTFDNVKKLTE